MIKNFNEFGGVKVASDNSPIGFYTIANAVSPEDFFMSLNKMNIKYKHDEYANFIEVYVKDEIEAKIVRDIALSEVFEADDITIEDIPYMSDPEEIGDAMEIKMTY